MKTTLNLFTEYEVSTTRVVIVVFQCFSITFQWFQLADSYNFVFLIKKYIKPANSNITFILRSCIKNLFI